MGNLGIAPPQLPRPPLLVVFVTDLYDGCDLHRTKGVGSTSLFPSRNGGLVVGRGGGIVAGVVAEGRGAQIW